MDTDLSDDFISQLKLLKDKFIESMDDDFNTAAGISNIFEIVKLTNTYLSGTSKKSKSDIVFAMELLVELTGVLGIMRDYNKEDIPDEVEKLAVERLNARKNRDFNLADILRNKIDELGYIIEDTKDGYMISKK